MVETKEKNTALLTNALLTLKNAFNVEADLVRPGAEHHGVSVIEGNLLTPMTDGAYNPRVPDCSQAEIDALMTTDILPIICEDYRQSAQVVKDLRNPNVVLSTAGGPDQPDAARRTALAQFMKTLSGVNPNVKFALVYHNNICGGCKHYTDDENVRIRNKEGVVGENAMMNDFAMMLVSEATALGVPVEAIRLYRSDVAEDNSYTGLTQIPIAG